MPLAHASARSPPNTPRSVAIKIGGYASTSRQTDGRTSSDPNKTTGIWTARGENKGQAETARNRQIAWYLQYFKWWRLLDLNQ